MRQVRPVKDISSLVGYERLAKRIGETVLQLPFSCHHCKRERFDLALIDGDGHPVCVACIDRCISILEGNSPCLT